MDARLKMLSKTRDMVAAALTDLTAPPPRPVLPPCSCGCSYDADCATGQGRASMPRRTAQASKPSKQHQHPRPPASIDALQASLLAAVRLLPRDAEDAGGGAWIVF